MKKKVEEVWIHSLSETPHYGSGRRRVKAEVGRKWVRIEPTARIVPGYPDWLTRDVYEQIRVGA